MTQALRDTVLLDDPTRLRVRVDGKFFARGRERLTLRGVTYGPFAPDAHGVQIPDSNRIRADFQRMKECGVNSVRVYHVPPERLLDLADEFDIGVLIDVPWPKHVCFLNDKASMAYARQAVTKAAVSGKNHRSVLGYSVCNEIAPNILRWHGSRRVEAFIRELSDRVHQADPDGLTTYANFPPTEYLDTSALDFDTFNVYLHDREAFRKYLFRLQHIVGDRPLVLGELGMDTLRHGEAEQAEFLAGHLRKSILMGLAGTFVFSWTDDWHTGGHAVEDWAFGVTTKDREPKHALAKVRDVYGKPTTRLLPETPRISVVVCTYNGARTLDECLASLGALDYPDYEVIVVDDGSTDATPDIVNRCPFVKSIRQSNLGLSVARNVGLHAATGVIVAYTDDDCVADPLWLTHMAYQFHRTGAAACGGPNLSPEDGRTAACVAASPGQPTHVLESDQEAEHIPGCNMAFKRDALLGINGFDPVYKKAGDDVDVCWRLQQAGEWITFAPGAVVWHHRRHTPRAYLKQQAGYGEAEAQLWFKHPDRFTSRGHGKWRGMLYGDALRGLRLSRPIIYRGTFAGGLFQTLYQPGPAHWAMLPSTLEWHGAMLLLALLAVLAPAAVVVAIGMALLSVLVAFIQAWQAKIPAQHDSTGSRLLVAALCYAQPLVRSWHRYKTRLFKEPIAARTPLTDSVPAGCAMPLSGRREAVYWNEQGVGRFELLHQLLESLKSVPWGKTLDTGWGEWDLQVHCHPWTQVEIRTAQEEHGGGTHLIRVHYALRSSAYIQLLLALAAGVGAVAAWGLSDGVVEPWNVMAAAFALLATSAAAVFRWRGRRRAAQVLSAVDAAAAKLGLLRVFGKRKVPASSPAIRPVAVAEPVPAAAS